MLTIIHAKTRQAVRDQVKGNKRKLPLDLRPKQTRAIRRRLTKVRPARGRPVADPPARALSDHRARGEAPCELPRAEIRRQGVACCIVGRPCSCFALRRSDSSCFCGPRSLLLCLAPRNGTVAASSTACLCSAPSEPRAHRSILYSPCTRVFRVLEAATRSRRHSPAPPDARTRAS